MWEVSWSPDSYMLESIDIQTPKVGTKQGIYGTQYFNCLGEIFCLVFSFTNLICWASSAKNGANNISQTKGICLSKGFSFYIHQDCRGILLILVFNPLCAQHGKFFIHSVLDRRKNPVVTGCVCFISGSAARMLYCAPRKVVWRRKVCVQGREGWNTVDL